MQYRISVLIPFAVPIVLGKLFQGIINFLFLIGALSSLFFINWQQALAKCLKAFFIDKNK